jgi:hypothetical protein
MSDTSFDELLDSVKHEPKYEIIRKKLLHMVKDNEYRYSMYEFLFRFTKHLNNCNFILFVENLQQLNGNGLSKDKPLIDSVVSDIRRDYNDKHKSNSNLLQVITVFIEKYE